jgi:hypothetical protein
MIQNEIGDFEMAALIFAQKQLLAPLDQLIDWWQRSEAGLPSATDSEELRTGLLPSTIPFRYLNHTKLMNWFGAGVLIAVANAKRDQIWDGRLISHRSDAGWQVVDLKVRAKETWTEEMLRLLRSGKERDALDLVQAVGRSHFDNGPFPIAHVIVLTLDGVARLSQIKERAGQSRVAQTAWLVETTLVCTRNRDFQVIPASDNKIVRGVLQLAHPVSLVAVRTFGWSARHLLG